MFGKFCATIFFQIIFSLYLEVELFNFSASLENTIKLSVRKPQICSQGEAPIDVLSNQAIYKSTPEDMTYHINIFGDAITKNNGRSVVINPKRKGTGFSLSGGFLGEDRYILHGFELYWTKDGKGRSASAIDKIGASLDIAIIYRNKKCGSIEKAKDYFKCILVSFVGILVVDEGEPNSRFQNYKDNGLKYVTTPNTNVSGNYMENIAWALPSKNASEYYIYYADYTDSYGMLFPCAAIMHLPIDKTRYITTKQFQEIFPYIQIIGSSQKPLAPNEGQIVTKYNGIIASLDNFEFVPKKDEL